MKPKPKLFVVRKDKTTPVHEVWIDDDWKKQGGNLPEAIGFIAPPPPEE